MRSKVLTYMKRFGEHGITGANPVSKLHHELNSAGGKRGQDRLDLALKELVEEGKLVIERDGSRIVRVAFSEAELKASTPTTKEQKMTVAATSVEEQTPIAANPAEEVPVLETSATAKPDMFNDVNRGLKVLQAAANPEGVLPEGTLPYELIMTDMGLKKPRALTVNRHLGKLGVRTTDLGRSTVKMDAEVTLEQFTALQEADKRHQDERGKQKTTAPAAQVRVTDKSDGKKQLSKDPILLPPVEPQLTPTLSEVLGGLVARVKALETERDTLKDENDGLRTKNSQLKEELEIHQVADELLQEAQRLLSA